MWKPRICFLICTSFPVRRKPWLKTRLVHTQAELQIHLLWSNSQKEETQVQNFYWGTGNCLCKVQHRCLKQIQASTTSIHFPRVQFSPQCPKLWVKNILVNTRSRTWTVTVGSAKAPLLKLLLRTRFDMYLIHHRWQIIQPLPLTTAARKLELASQSNEEPASSLWGKKAGGYAKCLSN